MNLNTSAAAPVFDIEITEVVVEFERDELGHVVKETTRTTRTTSRTPPPTPVQIYNHGFPASPPFPATITNC